MLPDSKFKFIDFVSNDFMPNIVISTGIISIFLLIASTSSAAHSSLPIALSLTIKAYSWASFSKSW